MAYVDWHARRLRLFGNKPAQLALFDLVLLCRPDCTSRATRKIRESRLFSAADAFHQAAIRAAIPPTFEFEMRARCGPDPLQNPRAGGLAVLLAGVLWLAAVAAGFAVAMRHEKTAAPEHAVASTFPENAICVAPVDKPMLIVFIHPKCPCTRASLEEIAALHRRCGDNLDMQFVFLERGDAPWRSEDTEHWETVRGINAGPAFVDVSGAEHRRFGATTSGETFLFMPDGNLAFHGGVTVGRGHSGTSAGRIAIEAIVMNPTASAQTPPRTKVYGCLLESPCRAAGLCGRTE